MMSKYDQAKKTGILHLNDLGLTSIPPEVFQLTNLVRLDLGWNELSQLPAQIGTLTNLEQLWVNSNPLISLPVEIEKCRKLRVLDLRDTELYKIPRELGRLPDLIEIDLRDVPLKAKLREANVSSEALMKYLAHKDVRKNQKLQLERKLREGIYREVADSAEGSVGIKRLVKGVFVEFQAVEEVNNLIRNAERLFPANLHMADACEIRKVFVRLKRQNENKKLSAELELKIRAIYFDRIDPQAVEGMVKSIYEEVTVLEDVQFLIRHAAALFPPSYQDVDGATLHTALVALQNRLAREREDAINGLVAALAVVYSDVEPQLISALADSVAVFFKKVDDLKSLASDAAQLFPAEFHAAKPAQVKRRFAEAKKVVSGHSLANLGDDH